MSGVRPPELDLPVEPPNAFKWIWMVFHEIAAGRQYTDRANPQRLSHQEILAWCTLTGERLTKRELSIIHQLDSVSINTRLELQRG